MNNNIARLYHIANKPTRTIIGLMSGTSLDGLDIALCQISGHGPATRIKVEQFVTRDYDAATKRALRSVSHSRAKVEDTCLINAKLGTMHGQWVAEQLKQWGLETQDVDLVASHGQTVFHAPKRHHQQCDYPDATLQLGDGDHVARACGIITLADFRQRHVAAGGEGAPLVVYGDQLIFRDATENRIMLNIGGIANLTVLPADLSKSAYCSDTGPGNTLMDAYMQSLAQPQAFDRDAQLALQGAIHQPLLTTLLNHEFFAQNLPKTTGPELFNLEYVTLALARCGKPALSDADMMATLNAFSAQSIARVLAECTADWESGAVYCSGGGAHNPLLMSQLAQLLPELRIDSTASLAVNPDAKEAMLFALLANECVAGDPFAIQIEGMPATTMGKVCFPD